MPRPIFACVAGCAFSVAVLSWAQFGCSGCGAAQTTQSYLNGGDAGECTTVDATILPDGGAIIAFVPCHFGSKVK